MTWVAFPASDSAEPRFYWACGGAPAAAASQCLDAPVETTANPLAAEYEFYASKYWASPESIRA